MDDDGKTTWFNDCMTTEYDGKQTHLNDCKVTDSDGKTTYRLVSGSSLKRSTDGRVRRAKYPFGGMKVGEFFLDSVENRGNVRRAAYGFGARNGGKFSVETIENGKVRVWRVS